MATVYFGGQTGRQPAQGEMRRFIVRSRVDGTVTPVNYADTNKVIMIPKGWIVSAVWPRIVKPSPAGAILSVALGSMELFDGDGASWGPSFYADSTVGTAGITGAVPTGGATWPNAPKVFNSEGYIALALSASYSSTGFDGIVDVFAEVINCIPYENPHSPSFAD